MEKSCVHVEGTRSRRCATSRGGHRTGPGTTMRPSDTPRTLPLGEPEVGDQSEAVSPGDSPNELRRPQTPRAGAHMTSTNDTATTRPMGQARSVQSRGTLKMALLPVLAAKPSPSPQQSTSRRGHQASPSIMGPCGGSRWQASQTPQPDRATTLTYYEPAGFIPGIVVVSLLGFVGSPPPTRSSTT